MEIHFVNKIKLKRRQKKMECKDCMNFDVCENNAKNTEELCDNFNANAVTIGDDETETEAKDFDEVEETTDKAGDTVEEETTEESTEDIKEVNTNLNDQIDSAINSLVDSVKNVVKDIKISKPVQEEKPKKTFHFKFGFWQYLTTACLVNGAVAIFRAIYNRDRR